MSLTSLTSRTCILYVTINVGSLPSLTTVILHAIIKSNSDSGLWFMPELPQIVSAHLHPHIWPISH